MPLCMHVPCLYCPFLVDFVEPSWFHSLPMSLLGGMKCWCTPKGDSGYPLSGPGSNLFPEVTFWCAIPSRDMGLAALMQWDIPFPCISHCTADGHGVSSKLV